MLSFAVNVVPNKPSSQNKPMADAGFKTRGQAV